MDDRRGGTGSPPGDDDHTFVYRGEVVGDRGGRLFDREGGWAAHNWTWLLGLGVIAVVFGVIVLSHAFGSLGALVWLTGLFLLFIGVAQLLTMRRGGAPRSHLLGAAVALIGGIVLLAWPGETLTVLAVIAGVTVLVWGIVRSATAFGRPYETRTHDVVMGIALIVAGAVMIAWPGATLTLVGVVVGLCAVVWGAVMIGGAFRLRSAGRRWRDLHGRSRVAR
jgi:uncharacterized membrane protein HdeD (DUF308 family)